MTLAQIDNIYIYIYIYIKAKKKKYILKLTLVVKCHLNLKNKITKDIREEKRLDY